MEALAAATSVISVISLAIQLADTIKTLHDFLSNLEGASEQIQRLANNLAHLKDILQDVSSITEMQRLQNNAPILGSTMISALKECQKNIESLDVFLKKAQVGYGSQRALRRKWNSLRVVVKMKDIKDFEDRIKDSMQRLTLSMMANLSTISISSHGRINILLASSQSVTHLQSPSSTFVSNGSVADQNSCLGPKFKIRTVGKPLRYEWRSLWKNRRIEFTSSTQELISANASHECQTHDAFSRKKTISISASFLQYYLRLQIEMQNGCWKHIFQIYRTISYNDKIWRLCYKDDIVGLQTLFASGEYSPFVVDERGRTLIHIAVKNQKTGALTLLLQLGVDANQYDYAGCTPLMNATELEICRLLVDSGQSDPATAFSRGFFRHPEATLWLLHQDKLMIDYSEVYSMHNFALEFGWSSHSERFESRSTWQIIFTHILKYSMKLSSLNRDGQTPLDCLFHSGFLFQQFDSQNVGMQWLELLVLNQINIKEYITEEKRLHADGLVVDRRRTIEGRRRYIFSQDETGVQNVAWEWATLANSLAFLVLEEFKAICHHDSPFGDQNWPFDKLIDGYYWDLDGSKVYQQICSRQAERRERRECRRNRYKTPREYQPRRRGRNRMPGSWIDYKHELSEQKSNFSLSMPTWLILTIFGLAGNVLLHVYLTQRNRSEGYIY